MRLQLKKISFSAPIARTSTELCRGPIAHCTNTTTMRRSSSGDKKSKRKSKTAPSLELGSLRELTAELAAETASSATSNTTAASNTNVSYHAPKKSPKDTEDKSPKPSDPSTNSSKKHSDVSDKKKKLREFVEELKIELHSELHAQREAWLTDLHAHQSTLLEARDSLARERALLAVQQRALQVQQVTRVTLNVGGVQHVTSLSTLTRDAQSMFAAMFSGRFNNEHVEATDCPSEPGTTPGSGITSGSGTSGSGTSGSGSVYFIDRDGALFSHVLNYLRTGTLHLTAACEFGDPDERGGHTPHTPHPQYSPGAAPELRSHVQLVSAVLDEAEFYNLTELAQLCRADLARHRQRLKATNHNTPRSRADSAYECPDTCMYTRKEVHQLLVSHQHVLITYQGPVEHRPLLNMAGVNLSHIDLSRLDLSYVDFSRANLEAANLESCILIGTVFAQANLQRANLQQCEFGPARTERESPTFVDANLRGANFSRFLGVVYRNNMEGANLADTIGLEEKWLV